ncbi:MAG: alpha/beta hydrolase [Planctomycetaceae bacterium]|nr:alpha/beta hydrolase [Planctomycetaceae bacterium]
MILLGGRVANRLPVGPACALAESELEFEGARQEIYKQFPNAELNLYIFHPRGHQPTDRRPAAVFFFGGGWNGGTPKQFEPHCRYLASRGMVAITADYRVATRHGTTPFDAVKDGKSAIRWIRANAARLGIDSKRIAAGGGSAGGHVAAATGNIRGLENQNEQLAISSIPNALLLFNPVYDNGPGGYGYERVKSDYQQISPFHNLRTGAPPTVVFFGTQDSLVPVATAVEYEKRMKMVGSRCETYFYEGQEHGFFNEYRHDGKYFRKTVIEMDRFLNSLGWLQGPPTLIQPTE